jgi:intein/homing endonuclease
MKATFFSADFVEDSNGELRLMEVNTDTSVIPSVLPYMDYNELISLLSTNNITKFTVVNKPSLHKNFVNHLSSSLSVSASFITTFTSVEESSNTIYPTNIPDSNDTFILRMAYDETAIFDSEYAKGTLNLLKLFNDYGDSGSVVQFYHSSSVNGYYNTIEPNFNGTNLPDAVTKNVYETHKMATFYKIGSETLDETSSNRWDNFINQISSEGNIVQKYHLNPSNVVDNKISSIRSFSIIYGNDLDLLHLLQYKTPSIFELPTEQIFDETKYVNQIDTKHYYEFATNYVKGEFNFDGILNRHLIIKSDDSEIEAGQIQVGDVLKSYSVSEWSLNENTFDWMEWSVSGDTLPSGSYLTSSVVIYKNTKSLTNKTLMNITVNNNEDSLFVAPQKSFLIHDSLDNSIKWKSAATIEPINHYLLDYDGSKVQVTNNELFITSEDNLSLVEIDVEDSDTYIIGGTTPVNSFVTHNSPCFVGDTKISLATGEVKNIDEIKSGDEICTFDLDKNEIVFCHVLNVMSKTVDKVVEYEFDNGEIIKCTLDHPIYVIEKGWSSFDNDYSNRKYSLEKPVCKIEVGDLIKLQNGDTKLLSIKVIEENVKVYNLIDIEKNHNFFANNILVHNRFCFVAGTLITLENGEVKKIEDIEIDDVVLSFNEKTRQQEFNKVTHIYKPNHDDLVDYELSNGKIITSTFDHPFYVDDFKLASYSPVLTMDRNYSIEFVDQIKVGHNLHLENGEITTIVSIKERERVQTKTYIFTVEKNNNFYANGVLVHNKNCFVLGTEIHMSDKTIKQIENIEIGDEVMSYNIENGRIENKKVIKLFRPLHDDLITYQFSNGVNLTCTYDHPFYVNGFNLASYSPELTNERYTLGLDILKIKVGDVVNLFDESTTLIEKITVLDSKVEQTYIFSVEDNNNFYANGILVHNK